jgi:hypothetical protein
VDLTSVSSQFLATVLDAKLHPPSLPPESPFSSVVYPYASPIPGTVKSEEKRESWTDLSSTGANVLGS